MVEFPILILITVQMQYDINLQEDEFVAKLILEDEEYSGCGATKKSARDNACNDALMNTKYHSKTTYIDKTPVSKLTEFCQNNMQVRTFKSGQYILKEQTFYHLNDIASVMYCLPCP